MNSWIPWKGGECPVPKGTLVDVKHRDNAVYFSKKAGKPYSAAEDWSHEDCSEEYKLSDIIAYRISK